MVKMQNFVLLDTKKQMIFIKTFQKILKLDLLLKIMNQIDHCVKGKKVIGLMKDELDGKIIKKFVRLRAKTYSYLIDDSIEEKMQKAQNSVS